MEVTQKVVDDYYVNSYCWRVIDEDGKVYAKGEGKTIAECLEAGRKHLKGGGGGK